MAQVFLPVPDFVFVREAVFLALLDVFVKPGDLSRIGRNFQISTLDVALDVVLLDPLVNNVIATPLEVPDHVGNAVAVLLLDLGEPANAIDDLPAVSSGRAPTDPVGLDQCHGIAAFGQREGSGNACKACANDADVR